MLLSDSAAPLPRSRSGAPYNRGDHTSLCAARGREGAAMLVASKELLDKVRAEGYAIPSPDFVDSNSVVSIVSESHP